ncbi:MAG: hypothetical protein KQH53_05950 [Desulfarculaceae bacterium]|nr:hypothetical protein [Desulfarculaceae bacterium]
MEQRVIASSKSKAPAPRQVAPYSDLLNLAKVFQEAGVQSRELGEPSLDYLWHAAQLRFQAGVLEELGVMNSTFISIEGLLERVVQGRGY